MMTPNKTNPFIHRLIPAATAAGLSLTLSACSIPDDPDPNVAPNNTQTQNNTNNATSGNMMTGNNMTSTANNTSNTSTNNQTTPPNNTAANQTTAPNNTSANQTTPPNNVMAVCGEDAYYVPRDITNSAGEVLIARGCHAYCDSSDASACMPGGECVLTSEGELCTQTTDPATNQTPNHSSEMCGEDAYYVASEIRNGVGEVILEQGCHAYCAIDNDCAPSGECLETSVGFLCSQLVSATNNVTPNGMTNNTTTEQNDGQLTDEEIRAFCQGFYDCDSTLFAESYDSVEACEMENRSYVDGVLTEVDQNYGTACADVFEAFYESYLNAGMCVGGTFNIDEMTLLEIESAFDSAYTTYCQD